MPFVTPSLSSVLAVLCHRTWRWGRRGLEQGIEDIRARRRARDILDRLAMLKSQCFVDNDFCNGLEEVEVGCEFGEVAPASALWWPEE